MAKGLVAMVAAFAFLFSAILASSSELHHLWHSDAGDSTHQCAVKNFSREQFVTPATATVMAATDFSFVVQLFPADTVAPSASDRRLAPSRAPPASA